MSEDEHEHEHEHEHERLPFDVEIERTPGWVYAASALVILASVLVASKVVSMFVLLPFLVVSSIGRRFSSAAKHVEVDEQGLHVDGRTVPRSAIRDVWVDDDPTEPRVVVASGDDVELRILHFENREQARRFGEELGGSGSEIERKWERERIVGYRPRAVDTLASLRFVAIAAAFFATGSRYGLFILVFFALGAWAVAQAKQAIASRSAIEIRTLFGSTKHALADVTEVDVDAGVLVLKSGAEIRLPRSSLRDATLASGTWLERGRARLLEYVRENKTSG